MRMRMLRHCDHCGKLQIMAFDTRYSCNPFGKLKAIVYTSKCKKCKHLNMIYKEV